MLRLSFFSQPLDSNEGISHFASKPPILWSSTLSTTAYRGSVTNGALLFCTLVGEVEPILNNMYGTTDNRQTDRVKF